MQQDIMNTMNDFGKNAFEAAKALGVINGKLVEKAIEQQLSVANLCVESGMQQVKLVQDSKDVKEYWTKQAALMEQYAAKMMDAAKDQVNLAQKAGEEYKSWLEKGVQQANVTAKAVTKKAV